MWWQDLLWGVWNGITAWIVLIAHVFGAWSEFPFYNTLGGPGTGTTSASAGNGFPLLGALDGGGADSPAGPGVRRRFRAGSRLPATAAAPAAR